MAQSTAAKIPDSIAKSEPWKSLDTAFQHIKNTSPRIADYFKTDPERGERFGLNAAGLFLDYSKNQLTSETLALLVELAEYAGMQKEIAAMFNGDIVNNTENRPALHVALRSQKNETTYEKEVHATLKKIAAFVAQVHDGSWKGYTGSVITDVVNIGIGGSDLGPAMVYQALSAAHVAHIKCHFVSNVDPVHLERTLGNLAPASTLFVIASKTFTTMETSLNAQAARAWVMKAGASEADLRRHFVAVSANVEKAAAFGIAPDNIFPMWNWVGGRYSLWSAIGLPVALGIGMAGFTALLQGANAMDEHFRSAPLAENMPVLMALLSLWYFNFWQAESQAILPYAQDLSLFPAFLQQLDMESLGKSVRKDGQALDTCSGGIVWGSAGTNGQHSFHQLLHQGTHLIPADFIAVAKSSSANLEQHEQLLANCFAQSQALMNGKSLTQAKAELLKQGLDETAADALAPHKVIPGNRPSNTLLLPTLDAASLGALIALYEHKVYAQSVLLQINAFDQWGVELGKALSNDIYRAIVAGSECSAFDASTNALINRVKKR